MQAFKQSQQTVERPIIFLPINKTQKYAWGSKDKNCWVGFMTEQHHDSYAQFWMGTHPSGQSKLSPQLSLKRYLNKNNIQQPEFLFKILSIEKCLSIQVHPNQEEAKQLHNQFPQIYVDDRDKPQMLLTLSEQFELFLGFAEEKYGENVLKIKPFKQISLQMPQLLNFTQKMIWMVQRIVNLSENQLTEDINTLFESLDLFQERRQSILRKIFAQFGYDTGILVTCLLQYHVLPKNSCFGIEAGVPHAYIKGECFELMKNSDNVVRLGLTPKQKDIPNLLKIIKNNIDRTYANIEMVQKNSIQEFEWNSYSIIKILLNKEYEEVEIKLNSIGILLDGAGFIRESSNKASQVEIAKKSVFFLKKGVYLFKGIGEVFIASKA